MKSDKTFLYTIYVIGFLARLIMAPISAHPIDMWNRYKTYLLVEESGYLNFHDFPPVYYHFIVLGSFILYRYLSDLEFERSISRADIVKNLNGWIEHMRYIPPPLFLVCIKLPIIIADILVALLLYKISTKVFNLPWEESRKMLLFWLLNPYVIFISSCWGMFDAIPALLTLASFYFLIIKRYNLSAFFLALAFACKLYPALILPLWLLALSRQNKKLLLKYLAIFSTISLTIMLPDLQASAWVFESFLYLKADAASPICFGLVFWSFLLLFYNNGPPEALVISIIIGSVLSSGTIYTVTLYTILKNQDMVNASTFLSYTLLALLPIFIAYRIVYEQWLVWLLPFIILERKKKFHKIIPALSLTALMYSVFNCPFPFFLFPLAYVQLEILLTAVRLLPLIYTFRSIVLVILGCASTCIFSWLHLKLLNDIVNTRSIIRN